MKKFGVFILVVLLVGIGLVAYQTLVLKKAVSLIPGKNDQLAWQILKNGSYSDSHVDSGSVTLADGVASSKYGGKDVTVSIANTRAYGYLNDDKNIDAAIALLTEDQNQKAYIDLVAVLGNGEGIESSSSIFLDENIYSGTISIVGNQIEVEYVIPEENYHTPARTILKKFKYADGSLSLVSTEDEEISINEIVKDNDPKKIELKRNKYSDKGVLELGKIQPYTISVNKGDKVEVKLISDYDDMLLSVFSDDSKEIILSVTDQKKQISGTVSESGNYTILVVPTSGNKSSYALSVSLKPAEKPVEPTKEPESVVSKPVTPPSGGGNTIYFTFDDGPWGTTSEILSVLNQYQAKATLFVIGRQVDRYRSVVDSLIASGSTIANHTWDHAKMTGMSRAKFKDEVTSTQGVLAGKMTNCLRPPGGAMDSFSRAYAKELGYTMVMWDIDTRDWARPGVSYIVSQVLNNAAPGKIVLMHDGGGDRSQTIAALKQILPKLQSSGYSFLPYCTSIIN